MTSFNLNYILKALSPDTVTMRAGVPTYKFGGNTTQCVAQIKVSSSLETFIRVPSKFIVHTINKVFRGTLPYPKLVFIKQ